jgi:3-deoxy-7-phosphoheptulonate synthase
MASGLSFPVGFKNGTDGNLQIAIDAMNAALHPHNFLGIDNDGRNAIVSTTGNTDVHIVLRGGNNGPNYHADDILRTETMLTKAGLKARIMVDCSHANSYKDHERQEEVLDEVIRQIGEGNRTICAAMIESNLEPGNQPTGEDFSKLKYGVSITDKCIGWNDTERMLRHAHQKLKEFGGRKIS